MYVVYLREASIQVDIVRDTALCFFFLKDPATTEIYPLPLHDALPIFINSPTAGEKCDAYRDGRGFRQSRHRPVDQVHLGLAVIKKTQQKDAGQEGGVGLPVEPVKRGRQGRGRQAVLVRMVETPAMHRPQLPGHAPVRERRIDRWNEVIVEPDEIE